MGTAQMTLRNDHPAKSSTAAGLDGYTVNGQWRGRGFKRGGKMSNQAGALAVERMMQKYGCLPSAPDGPAVEHFTPLAVAQAIEHELNRASEYGFTKVTLHMDLIDAALLARELRKG
jgi:hypothetical protein